MPRVRHAIENNSSLATIGPGPFMKPLSCELAGLVCCGSCNPQLPSYDEMVDQAMRARSRIHDYGDRMAMTAYGVPAWRTVGAVYTSHFRVGNRWQCSKCGQLRKWGDD